MQARLATVSLNGASAADYHLNALGQRLAKTTAGGLEVRHFHNGGTVRLIA